MMTDSGDDDPRLEWRGDFTNAELSLLHANSFGHPIRDEDWWRRVNTVSLGWVCLRFSGSLAGFVNVAWDGGAHAFLLDTMVATPWRRQGWARRLVEKAVAHARLSGCEWLHVDFEPHLRDFYLGACKFVSTEAGLIRLR